jgi:hypothetical protein
MIKYSVWRMKKYFESNRPSLKSHISSVYTFSHPILLPSLLVVSHNPFYLFVYIASNSVFVTFDYSIRCYSIHFSSDSISFYSLFDSSIHFSIHSSYSSDMTVDRRMEGKFQFGAYK